MSIQKALLVQDRAYMMHAKAQRAFLAEIMKGCRSEIASRPVALEPVYQSFLGPMAPEDHNASPLWMPESPAAREDMIRLRVWISPDQKCDWARSELFLKQLSHIQRRAAFEIIGNNEHIAVQLLCHKIDLPVVRAAFGGEFEQCQLCQTPTGAFLESFPAPAWQSALFWDFFPSPPYSHLFTSPEELKRSPYATLIAALVGIADPAMGFYQVVFAPVLPSHNWHQNVQTLLNLEYRINQINDVSSPTRYPQQVPSDALNVVSMEVTTKAHNDKPFFAAALRIPFATRESYRSPSAAYGSSRFQTATGKQCSGLQAGRTRPYYALG